MRAARVPGEEEEAVEVLEVAEGVVGEGMMSVVWAARVRAEEVGEDEDEERIRETGDIQTRRGREDTTKR
jgi:hypothetical protein